MTANAQSNRHFWHSETTTAEAAQVWATWTDVATWKQWDTGLKDAHMEGAFELGAKGKIVSLEGRTSTFKIVDFEPGKSYTFKTNLPLGGLYVKRYWELVDGQTQFTHEVWFQGLTAGLFAKAFGPRFREMLPGVLENIKNSLEQ